MTEHVSPELALVDPELAVLLRGQADLWEVRRARWQRPRRDEPGPAVPPLLVSGNASARRLSRRHVFAALSASLAAIAVAATQLSALQNRIEGAPAARSTSQPAVVRALAHPILTNPDAAPTATLRHRQAPPHAKPLHGVRPKGGVIATATSASVERAVLASLPAAARLHPFLASVIDHTTGLIQNGTVVTCKPLATTSYRCVVSVVGVARPTSLRVTRGPRGQVKFTAGQAASRRLSP